MKQKHTESPVVIILIDDYILMNTEPLYHIVIIFDRNRYVGTCAWIHLEEH